MRLLGLQGAGFVCLLLLAVSACAEQRQANCENDNKALQSMESIVVEFSRADGSTLEIEAKLAADNATRAAGFQRVCEERIATTNILFDFNRQVVPRFHMRNVVAPLDIAFIAKDGSIDSIHRMLPYVIGANDRPLYSPSSPIVVALETRPGFFEDENVDLTTKVRWRKD